MYKTFHTLSALYSAQKTLSNKRVIQHTFNTVKQKLNRQNVNCDRNLDEHCFTFKQKIWYRFQGN